MMHWQRHVSVVTNHVLPKIVNSAPWFGTAFCCFCFLLIFRNWTSQKDFQQINFYNWGQWSAWSPCTRSSLQKTRRREVLTPPEGVGMPCNISLVEARIVHFKSLKQTWSMKLSHVFFLKHDIYDLYLSTTSSRICWEAGRCAPIVWILDS